MTFLETQFGKPFTSNGFGNWFARRCREAKVDGSAHGLCKAGVTIAAENGATTRALMAMYGWLSSKQAEGYTREADQKRLAGAGMPLLFLGQTMNKSVPLSDPSEIAGQKSSSTG